MSPRLKARVRNGRFVLDDPATDLPEGTEVELVVVGNELDERASPLDAIEEGAADIERGDYVDGIAFADELLARREAASR